jgi:hypothetical protein
VQLWFRGWRTSEVKKAKEICEQLQPQAVPFDPWGITELERILNGRRHHAEVRPSDRQWFRAEVAGWLMSPRF